MGRGSSIWRGALGGVVAVAICAVLAVVLRAEEPQSARRAELLRQMRGLARETSVEFVDGGRRPLLVENPVFRYDDQPRRFIDATIWAWTNEGRPVAFQKIEARRHQTTDEPQWGYCFTSLAEEKLEIAWPPARRYRTTEPGIAFQRVPNAPAPAARNADRRRQAREIARGFSGRIVINPKTDNSAEMRLLPTPLLEYEDAESKRLAGAVFGLEINGTNPDVLVLVEVRGDDNAAQWHFAVARMTTGGVTLHYRNKPVWQAPFVQPQTGPYATWCFFATPRTPVTGEEEP